MSQWSQDFSMIDNYYRELIETHGDAPQSCDYGSDRSQAAKFAVLSQSTDYNKKHVLDVGCGLGDYRAYLKERFNEVDYTGIDLSSEMIEIAGKKFPDGKFYHRNLFDMPEENAFDVVSSNGIFYLIQNDPYGFMEQAVSKMISLSRGVVLFTSLSSWFDEQTTGEFWADPLKVLEICRQFTPYVALRHDYLPHDFTIMLIKK